MAVGVTVATLLALGTPFAQAQIPAAGKRKRSDILRTLPITKFYDTPDPLPPGKPGELIRLVGDSVKDQIAWIEARFSGRTPATNYP